MSLSGAPPRWNGRYLAQVLGVAGVYLAAAKFGFLMAFATRQVTAEWPPTGIALVALLLLGNRLWPGIFLGALLANVLTQVPLAPAVGIAIGNTLTGLLGAFLLRQYLAFDPTLVRTREVLSLVLVAPICTVVSASGGVANLAAAGLVPWSAYGSVWWVWWMGDTLGILIIAPFLLAWVAQPRLEWRGRRLGEFAALFTALVLVGYLVFWTPLPSAAAQYPLAYAAFPFLIWAALRFGLRETVSAALLLSGIAIWGAIHERGPFSTGTLDERLIALNAFLAVTEITALLMGAATAEERRSQASLRLAHDELEERVQERTAELMLSNIELREVNDQLNGKTVELAQKNEEVEAIVTRVSQDFRAPLQDLQGYSKELETNCRDLGVQLGAAALPPAVEGPVHAILADGIPGALRFIAACTAKFQRLMDALLQLSQTAQQVYHPEAVDVRTLVEARIHALGPVIKKSGALVMVDPLPVALGDRAALTQVFSNLLENALAYLKPDRSGAIELGGEALEPGFAQYWVRDNGVGIPRSAQPRLFQVFQRFHPGMAEGQGMGLAIAKRIVVRHGGKIWAESEAGEGTTIYLTLPSVKSTEGV